MSCRPIVALAGALALVLMLAMTAAQAQGGHANARPTEVSPLAAPRFESVGANIIPRGVVASLAQDEAGFIWIATGDGLVRFDGYRYAPAERDVPDPVARNLGWVRATLPDRDGRLWIGTEAHGLAVHDPDTHRITLFPLAVDATLREGQAAPIIHALAQAADGSLWMGREGDGAFHIDPVSGRVVQYRAGAKAGGLPDDRVHALHVDAKGQVWAGTAMGLAVLRAGASRFEAVLDTPVGGRAPGLRGRQVNVLSSATDGALWVGTAEGDLLRVNPQSNVPLWLSGGKGSAGAAVNAIMQQPDGPLWVARSSGIDLHEVTSGHLQQRLRHDPSDPAGLAGNEVVSLLLSQSGAIWAGGYGMGLQRHDPLSRHLRVRGSDPIGGLFRDPDTRALVQVAPDEIWAASHGGAITILDGELRARDRFMPPAPAQRSARVTAMARMADGRVWLGQDGRLLPVDARTRRTVGPALVHEGGVTNRLSVDREGNLWVATQNGLFRLPPSGTRLERIPMASGEPLNTAVQAAVQERDGRLWVGTVSGLFQIPPGQQALHPVESPPGAGLGTPVIAGILFDRQGTMWLDTAVTGLHQRVSWDGRAAAFSRTSARHGVVNRPFGANLMEDARGRLWTHIYVYDPAADRLTELTQADGVTLGTGWFFVHIQLQDGRMLIGGSKGILVIVPEEFDTSDFQPPVVLSELRIDGTPQQVVDLKAGLHLDPTHKAFSAEFAALDFSDPGRLRYEYRLEGFDTDWIATGADLRVAAYSNLRPGDYTLRVRGTNRSGLVSPHELSLPVTVQAAWWQTLPAKLALLAVAMVAVTALVAWRTRRLRQEQTRLESVVAQRTVELRSLAQALQRKSDTLEEMSLTDPLTDLRNRRFLVQHIDDDVHLVDRRYKSAALRGELPADDADLVFYLFDIDHFKRVNDSHGHDAGDAVIVQMRDRLRAVFRESDHLVRWGGEEFLVVARGSSRKSAPILAERARATIADQPFVLPDGQPLAITASVGFACLPVLPKDTTAFGWQQVLKIADQCLLLVKQSGRNGWLGLLDAPGQDADSLRALLRQSPRTWPPLEEGGFVGSSTVCDALRALE